MGHGCKMSAIFIDSLFGFCNPCKLVFCTSTEFTRHVEGFPDEQQHIHANSINVLRSIAAKNNLEFVKDEYVVSCLFLFELSNYLIKCIYSSLQKSGRVLLLRK